MKLPLIPANEEQRRKIYQQLNEDEERHRRQLEVFKEWIKSENHLPCDLGDAYVENFLRLCKHDLEKAKKKFEANILLRAGFKEVDYDSVLSKEAILHYELSRQCVLTPHLTSDGYRVFYFQMANDAKKMDMELSFKYGLTLGDIMLLMDLTAGTVFVANFGNITVEHMSKCNLTFFRRILSFVLHTYPTRLKEYHILNLPPFAKPLAALIKAAMPEKVKARLFIHDEVEQLKDYLEENVVPKDFGGSCESIDCLAKRWEDFYLENNEWKDKLKKLKLRGPVPEHKRHFFPSEDFGVDGCFRNLQVD